MSAPRWLGHFGLDCAPFGKDIEDTKLWVPSTRKAIVDQFVEACRERGHVLLTGEPGVGKTCVLRAVRQRLKSGFRITYCHNATLGRRDFYRQLCTSLNLTPKATAAGVFAGITGDIEELQHARVHPVFLMDEAHLLNQQVLEHLHILSNYGWDSVPLLSLALVGLPDLEERLRFRKNRSLWSRIHTRLRMGEAKVDDTAEYMAHRLALAGVKTPLFDSDALTLLHETTEGRLRDVDRVATNALKAAARRKVKLVDRFLIEPDSQPDSDD